jgi:hypothetical protein
MKKILLLITLVSTFNVFAQQKVIKMNARVGGTMITFSLYQKQTDNTYLLVDSKEEDSGQWTFDSLSAGIYRVHMSMAYAKYIPTWHPRKAIWDEAADIDLTATDTALCDEGMLPNPSFTGPASISGELTEGMLKTAGDPLKNVRVVIKDGTGALVKMTSTNDSGKFVAGNLPVGSYKIIVDMINVPTANAKTVVLDSTNLTASVDLTVNSGGTVNTGLKNYLDHGLVSINVYPNPTTDELYVNSDTDVKITVSSIQGVLVREAMVNNNQSLSLESLPKGLYVATLVVPGTGEMISKKIVKE